MQRKLYSVRPSDRVRNKMKNYAEIFGNIIQKKVTIMRKRRQIMQNFFLKVDKVVPYKLTSYREFQFFMTCLTICFHFWTGISLFNTLFAQFSLLSLSEAQQPGIKLDKETRTQAHHQRMHGTPGGFKLFTNKKRVFVAVLTSSK